MSRVCCWREYVCEMPTSLSCRIFLIVCNANTVDHRYVYGIAITMLAHEFGACNFAAVITPHVGHALGTNMCSPIAKCFSIKAAQCYRLVSRVVGVA